MNALQKLWAMIVGKTNDAVDNNIDPATIMRQAIRELDAKIKQSEKAYTDVLSNKNLVNKQYLEAQKEADSWNALAAKAMNNGQENEARQAIERAMSYENTASTLKTTLDNQILAAEKINAKIEQMKAEKTKAESDVTTIHARTEAAKAALNVQAFVAGIGDDNMSEMMQLARQKVDQLEAKSEAINEIDNSRTSLRDKIEGSTSLSVEERLNALRNKQS